MNLSKKADIARLKSEIDKLDIDEWEITPVYLNKLSDVGQDEVVRKTVYDKLVKKVNAYSGYWY